MSSNFSPRFLSRDGLRARGIEYSNVHLLRLEKKGSFPKRIRLGENKVAWAENEIDQWMLQKMETR